MAALRYSPAVSTAAIARRLVEYYKDRNEALITARR